MNNNPNAQVVVITGASGNLGQAAVRIFHSAGANLALIDHKPDRLDNLFPDLTASPMVQFYAPYDVANPESTAQAIDRIFKRYARIDVLLHTVGGYQAGNPVHQTDVTTLDAMWNLNVRTAFVTSQAVIPHMLDQKSGKIILVSSRAGLNGSKNAAAYSAAKSAVIRLCESMSAELKEHNIQVNCVMPGTIDTPENRVERPNADRSKWVTPEAVAEVILFLASPAARAVTGAIIPVFGTG